MLEQCRALVVDVSDAAGVAVVRRLAGEGARVAFSCADLGRAGRLVGRVRGFGREATHLSGLPAGPELVAAAAEVLGGVDLLVVLGGADDGGQRSSLGSLLRAVDEADPANLVTVIAPAVDADLRIAAGVRTRVRLLSVGELGLDRPFAAEDCAAAVVMLAAGYVPATGC